MPIQTSHISARDKDGKFHTIECRTTTPKPSLPGVVIINGENKFFREGVELKVLGNGRYETPDGQVLVDPDEA